MINTRSILVGFLVLSTLTLCLVWPIPNNQIPFHRNIFIYNVIIISLGLFFRSSVVRQSLDLSKIKFVLIVISLLTAFILVNGFFVAPDIKEMVSAWNGQWLRPVLLFFSGIVILPVIHSCFPSISAARFFTLIVLFFWGVVCIHLLDNAWLYWRDGMIHWGETRIVYNRTRMSFQVNMITSFLIAELLARSLLNQCFLRLNTLFLTIMLLCNLVCTVLIDTRWGTIGLVASLFSSFVLIAPLAVQGMRRNCVVITVSIFIGIVAVSALLGYVSLNNDSRWHSLKNDIFTGWNALFNSFCYIKPDGAVPTNELGLPMNHSNGCRASFFHQGWKLVGKHPAGIGPHKEAFRYVLRHDIHDNHITIPHSHYGLIEFGIQNGIMGIIGWLILLASCWYTAWHQFRYGHTVVGIFLLLFTTGFFLRTMVDHNLKDHYLEQYMFLMGLLMGICVLRIKQSWGPSLPALLLDYDVQDATQVNK